MQTHIAILRHPNTRDGDFSGGFYFSNMVMQFELMRISYEIWTDALGSKGITGIFEIQLFSAHVHRCQDVTGKAHEWKTT